MAVSCQSSTHSRETLRGCPRHPFSTADFCVLLSDMPEGNWGTVKTLVILSWIKLISWLCFYICEPTRAHCENGSRSMKEKKRAHGCKSCTHKGIYVIPEHKALLLYMHLSVKVRDRDFWMKLSPSTELGSKQVCLNTRLFKTQWPGLGKQVSNSILSLYSN